MTSVSADRRQGVNSSAAIKVAVRVATTANITLSGLQTIDGVALAANDRVLVKNQTTTSENGIYDVDSGNWSRSIDFDGSYDVVEGTIVAVSQGSTLAATLWRVSTTSPSVGSALTFVQSSLSPADSNSVSFTAAGAGAVTRTAQGKMRDVVSVLDYMPAADVALVISNTTAGQNATAVTAAFTAALAAASAVYAPAGSYVTDSVIAIPAFKGVYGDGYGTFMSPSVGNNGIVFNLGADITTLSTRPFLKDVRITPNTAHTGVTMVKLTSCQLASIDNVNCNSFTSKNNVGFAVDGGDISGYFNLFTNCSTSACLIGFDHYSTGSSYPTQQIYIDCNAVGSYPTVATGRGFRFYREATTGNVCGLNSSIYGGDMENNFIGIDVSGPDDPNTAAGTNPSGINFNGVRFEGNKYNFDLGANCTRNTFTAIKGYESFAAGGASYRTTEPRSLQEVGLDIECVNNPHKLIASSTSIYETYYYSTSTVAGYVGNGQGLIGSAPTDFGIRSQAALAFYAGGANKWGAISATGDLTLLATNPIMKSGGATGSGTYGNDDGTAYFTIYGHSHASAGNIGALGHVRPVTHNTYDLGTTALRWKDVWCQTAAFNGSDARLKTPVSALTEAEIAAAKDLAKEIGAYQWLESIQKKGNAARRHIGLTVQRVEEIMKSHGLDPWRYGFMAYDKWDDVFTEHEEIIAQEAQPAVFNEKGEVIQLPTPAREGKPAWREQIQWAGDGYSFRGDQLNLFIAAGFEARLAALEVKA